MKHIYKIILLSLLCFILTSCGWGNTSNTDVPDKISQDIAPIEQEIVAEQNQQDTPTDTSEDVSNLQDDTLQQENFSEPTQIIDVIDLQDTTFLETIQANSYIHAFEDNRIDTANVFELEYNTFSSIEDLQSFNYYMENLSSIAFMPYLLKLWDTQWVEKFFEYLYENAEKEGVSIQDQFWVSTYEITFGSLWDRKTF